MEKNSEASDGCAKAGERDQQASTQEADFEENLHEAERFQIKK